MEILNRSYGKRAKTVRLVGSGESRIVDFDEAWSLAEESELDLVLVSEQVQPPVVKIQDLKKIEYEKKKARQRTKTSSGDLKEIQLKVNISDHDLGTKVNSIKKFLGRGDKVKVSVRLKGRERDNPERAKELLEKVVELVDCKVTFMQGPVMMAILEAVKKI